MNEGRTSRGPAARAGSGAGRLIRAWRAMPRERRLAAWAAFGLFVTMFLPWYQRQFFVVVGGKLAPGSDTQTAWAQFSFVEAAVLLVAIGVLTLLFQRAEGKAFHLPGGDGWVIMVAGCWTCVLIVWRIFDKQGGHAHGQNATTYGIEWGIFIALAVAASLAYAGSRIRGAHRPEPPLPGERPQSSSGPPPETAPPPGGRPEARPERATHPKAPPSRRERREVGWLTAPPRDRPHGERDPKPRQPSGRPRSDDWTVPEWSGDSPPEWDRPARPQQHAGETPPGEPPARPQQPAGATPPEESPARSPKPVPADGAPTIRVSRGGEQEPPIPPSTRAARRRQEPDDELTIPLERDD